jgi:integrase
MNKSINKPIHTDITFDVLYIEYIHYRNLRPETIRSYTRKLTIYSNITGMTLTQLIEEAESDEDLRIRKRLRRIKLHLIDLQEYLISRNYSPQKIDDIITTIRGFYAYYEIDLPKRTYHAPIPDLQKEAIPTKEDVKKALSYCNTKYQAIILLMSSSGISIGDVLNLKVSDFLSAINIPKKQHQINKLNIKTVNDFCEDMVPIWQIQSGTSHITFNTPKTTRKILDYLIEHPPRNVDDPLFRGKTGKGLRSDVFQRFLRKLNIECEWGYIGRQIFFHSHILRKIFANKLEEAGMPHHYIRQLMGHRKDPLTRTYFSTPSEKLREEYNKFLHNLNFLEETK